MEQKIEALAEEYADSVWLYLKQDNLHRGRITECAKIDFLAGFKAAQGVMGDLIKYKVAQYELELSGNILSKIGIAYNGIRIKELNDLLEKLK